MKFKLSYLLYHITFSHGRRSSWLQIKHCVCLRYHSFKSNKKIVSLGLRNFFNELPSSTELSQTKPFGLNLLSEISNKNQRLNFSKKKPNIRSNRTSLLPNDSGSEKESLYELMASLLEFCQG